MVVTDLLIGDLQSMVDAWAPGNPGNYRAYFLDLDSNEALVKIITGIEELSRGELAGERMVVAYEARSQEDEHSCFSDNTVKDIIGNARGIENVWLGDYGALRGPGVVALVRQADPELAELLTVEIANSVAYARALDTRIQTLADEPSADNLSRARSARRDARSASSRVQAYTFGPVMERRIPSLIDWWPIDEAKIHGALARPTISAEDVRETFAPDQRGFSALEHLLFADDDSLLGRLESGDRAYGQYLMSLSSVIADAIQQASDDWSGDYGKQFSGSGNRAIAEALAIADLVRVPVFLTETIGDMQPGVALGITKPDADPEVIPGGNAHQALSDLEQSIRGIQDTYLGDADGLGLSDLVAQLSEDTDQRMRDTLTQAIDAIGSLRDYNQPLKQLVQSDPDAVAEVRDAIKAMQVILNTEVVSLLGVSIGFSDNDGDS